jgi:hypothetical protein
MIGYCVAWHGANCAQWYSSLLLNSQSRGSRGRRATSGAALSISAFWQMSSWHGIECVCVREGVLRAVRVGNVHSVCVCVCVCVGVRVYMRVRVRVRVGAFRVVSLIANRLSHE